MMGFREAQELGRLILVDRPPHFHYVRLHNSLGGRQRMETLEVKTPSWRARLWARLSDPDKRPRRWWFPPSSRRDEVRRVPDAARQDYQKSVQQAHEKFSETVRLAMLSL